MNTATLWFLILGGIFLLASIYVAINQQRALTLWQTVDAIVTTHELQEITSSRDSGSRQR